MASSEAFVSQAVSTWSLAFTCVIGLSLTSTVVVTHSLTVALVPSVSVTNTTTGDNAGTVMLPDDVVTRPEEPESGDEVLASPLDAVSIIAEPDNAP